MQWTDPIYPILLNNNHKIDHSLIGLTPNDASMPSTAFDAYINRTYPVIKQGIKLCSVSMNINMFPKPNVSVWSDLDITDSHGNYSL